ncbi:FtsX-like permease family protein [Georgenia subflava]|uniref:FtsX-like permease family protein n=1 Tax=Georgenia subflava TaxID=1622177 RepID=A0A6N7EFT5_9MICO|nr:FtsX-like permease family protein [Georgenia subflava]MPV36043.1 FtsX-like permease family protein [Georgenia subflava]
MRAAVRMWWLLRRRSAGRSDPQGLTTVLALVAFAVTTAVLLVVLGGLGALLDRAAAAAPGSSATSYPLLAGTATALLAVPLLTLGGAASRLAVARRDSRLAALRLAGATTGQVSLLTILDAAAQALAGALIGVVGHLGLLPAVMQLRFQGRAFDLGELLVPWWMVPAAVAAVVAVSVASAVTSLRTVAISPLGVAARVSPKGLHWSRVLPLGVTAAAFVVMFSLGLAEVAVLIALVVVGFATLNVIGPFVMSLIGRVTLRRARGPATLIAARRVLDSPKTAWRSVGGVALATFVAGLTTASAMFDAGRAADPAEAQLLADLATGGFLTLGIAGILAAVSTAVMQAGRVIDQRGEYRALHLAGTDLRVLDAARVRETTIPLLAAVALSGAAASVFLLPAFGLTLLTSVPVMVQLVLCVSAAVLLVLVGTLTSRRVVRTVLA